jgi:signal transduction histidine kinase
MRRSQFLPDPVDLALGVGLTSILAAQLLSAGEPSRLVGAFLAGVPLAYRRRFPLAAFFPVFIGVIITASQETFWPAMVAGMVATYSVGAYSRYRALALGVFVVLSTGILVTLGGDLPPVPEFLSPYLILCTPWLVGVAIRGWQQRAGAFEDKARRLEEDQERAAHAARVEERERMARELHDVVAHGVSVMVIQAGAARQVLTSSPEEATQALLAVEATGREAMAELRNLLGALNPDEQLALAPQPGLDQLDSLVRRVEEAGLPVDLHIEGRPRPLPAGIDLTAYRIVQEALTNALKYSGHARTAVFLDYRERELKIEVLDEGDTAPALENGVHGRGLAGMRERVALYGGALEAGPRLERGYAVRVWLPLETLPL